MVKARWGAMLAAGAALTACSPADDGAGVGGCLDDAIPTTKVRLTGYTVRWCERPTGEAHGWYEEVDEDGVLRIQGQFVDDVHDGRWTFYDAKERPDAEQEYALGVRCGTWKDYAGGQLLRTIELTPCDELDVAPPDAPPTAAELGVWDGQACPAGEVEEGPTGATGRYRACVVGGVREGPYTAWTVAGSVAEAGTYAAGQRDGAWQAFWSNGQVHEAGAYTAGQRTGAWTRHDPLGRLVEESTWAGGLLDGPWTAYYADGAKQEAGAYAAGLREGAWTWWHADGAVAAEGQYQAHLPVGTWRYVGATGHITTQAVYNDAGEPHGTWRVDYAATVNTGAQYSLQPFVNGALHGLEQGFWTADDAPIFELTWFADLRQGPFIEWHRSGEVRARGQYVTDQPDGLFEGFYEDGTKEAVQEYDVGQRVGTWSYWWPSGQLRGTGSWAHDLQGDDWSYFLEDGTPATAQEVGL